jgi:hypothetical protein
MWKPRCLTTLWASTVCYKNSFTFTTKAYNESGGILNHQYRLVIAFTLPYFYYRWNSPRYPQDRGPVGSHSPSGRKRSSPITIPIKLCRLVTDDTTNVVEYSVSSYRSGLKLGTWIKLPTTVASGTHGIIPLFRLTSIRINRKFNMAKTIV